MKILETETHLKKSIENLHAIVEECISSFKNDAGLIKVMNQKYNISEKLLQDIDKKSSDVLDTVLKLKKTSGEAFFNQIKTLLLNDYGTYADLLKMLFYQIVFYTGKLNILDFVTSSDEPTFNKIGGNYLRLTVNFKDIKNTINQFFFKDIKLKDELVVDNSTELWAVTDMEHKIFPSDFLKIREYSAVISRPAEDKIEKSAYILLQQQISEMVKNAIKHGNKNDVNNIVKTWYSFDNEKFKIIVEDQGEGFKDLEKWNEFNQKRNKAIINQDMEMITKLVSFKTKESDDEDGGNALFAAMEYWDSGLIFNNKRNKVLAVKYFFYN